MIGISKSAAFLFVTLVGVLAGAWYVFLVSEGYSQVIKTNPESKEPLTQVLLGADCPIRTPTAESAAIPTEIALGIGKAVVSSGAKAIEVYLDDFAKSYSAGRETILSRGYFYRATKTDAKPRIDIELKCITLVRGRVGKVDLARLGNFGDRQKLDPTGVLTGRDNNPHVDTLTALRLVEYPDLLIVMGVDLDQTKRLFTVIPRYVYFRRLDPSQHGDVRDIAITLTFRVETSSASDDQRESKVEPVLVPVILKGLQVGAEYSGDAALTYDTSWAALPSAPNDKALDAIRNSLSSAGLKDMLVEPFNLNVTLDEIGNPGPFVKLLLDIAKGAVSTSAE
jgi:hypothetical protein